MTDLIADPTTPADEAKLLARLVTLLDKAHPDAQARLVRHLADMYQQAAEVGTVAWRSRVADDIREAIGAAAQREGAALI